MLFSRLIQSMILEQIPFWSFNKGLKGKTFHTFQKFEILF